MRQLLVPSSYAGALLLLLLHHAPAPVRSMSSEARATATCVGNRRKSLFLDQLTRLQAAVARHARVPERGATSDDDIE